MASGAEAVLHERLRDRHHDGYRHVRPLAEILVPGLLVRLNSAPRRGPPHAVELPLAEVRAPEVVDLVQLQELVVKQKL